MPKKSKKRSKNTKNKSSGVTKRELQFKDEMQEYAVIIKMLGDRRVMVTLPDKSEQMAIIPGRFRKRCWMKVGDILLISRREFQTDKLDVIHKYNEDEVRRLINVGEIPPFFKDPFNKCEKTQSSLDSGEIEDAFIFDDI